MYRETTLYIRNDLLEKLDDAASTLDISRSMLVSILLVKYIKKNKTGSMAFERLRYQKREENPQYSTKSLSLRKNVYELWCDVRKVFKLSASHLIALAIEMYLDELLTRGEPYNYLEFYLTKIIYHGNACLIQIIWGAPEPEKLKQIIKAQQ